MVSKNLVIFSDGTGNELKAKGNSNAMRLHGMTLETSQQIRFYDAGVGTQGSSQALTGVGRGVTRLLGLGFGYGLKSNVVECYAFIMRRWEPGDSIYLFGFSRGAYTVRALAGMLRVIGLLRPDQENMVPYALKLFWKGHGKSIDWDHVNGFARQFAREDFERWGHSVEFLGIWDTVKAVGWFTRRLQLPYTRLLKSVKTVRHACSLDEWRAQYKAYTISETELGKQDRDMKEVWFAGVHSDVGGSYEPEHQLGDISMAWIGSEAIAAGLRVDEEDFAVYRTLPPSYASGTVHGLGKIWIPLGVSRRRVSPPGGRVHESVVVRMESSERERARYQRKGVGPTNPVEPWPTGPELPT